ncbi:MAG: type II secretion system protein GspF, partial [Comamonadaceae bacterium]
MPAYSFEALDAEGRARKGVLEADTARAARGQLRAQALIPLSVQVLGSEDSTGGAASGRRSAWSRRVFNATELTVWTRQLAGLVTAGLPLERALTALTEESEREDQRQLLAALRSEVNGGSTFARALAQHPREFSTIYTAVIGAGEQSGNLGMVLERLADDLEQRQALQQKLVGATLYPAIVTVIAIVIVIFLVSYVVPQVASVFAGTKRALPLLTVIMLTISDIVRQHGWLLLGALVGLGLLMRAMLAREAFRERFDAAWLRLPLIGRLARG